MSISKLVSYLRFTPVALFIGLALLWVASLPIGTAIRASKPDASVNHGSLTLPALIAAQPGWRDTLVLRIAITDTAIQQQHGFVLWQTGPRIARYPLVVLADARPHIYVLPLGINPDWSGQIRNLQVVFPVQRELQMDLDDVLWVQRSPFALDALLGRMLAPVLPAYPPWPMLVLDVGVALCAATVLSVPRSVVSRPTSLQVLGWSVLTLGGIAAVSAVVAQLDLLPPLWQRYAALDEATAALHVPHYVASSQIDPLLASAAARLPDGAVLVLGQPADAYLYARAFYRLFPRRVTFGDARQVPPLNEYAGVIMPARALPPQPGWQLIAGPAAGLEVWRAPEQPAATATATLASGPQAVLLAIAAITLVLGVGWSLAGVLGWRGWMRLACALPFGAGVLAWWMALLSWIGGPWSPWSIGSPLVLLIAGLLVLSRRGSAKREAEALAASHPLAKASTSDTLANHRNGIPWYQLAGAVIVALLTVCVTTQAVLTPFTDQDSWTTWGYNSRAFYTSGSLQAALYQYGASQLNHPSYPPALPLLQVWQYVMVSGISERMVKLFLPLWYLSLVVLVWSVCRQWAGGRVATALAILVATTPLFLDHATLDNADLPFAVMLLVAVIALCRWIETGARRALLTGGLALAVAAWTKLDGLYLGVAIMLLAGLLRAVATHSVQPPELHSLRSIGLETFGGVMLLLLIVAPWLVFTRALGIASEAPDTSMLKVVGLSNLGRGLAVIGSELAFSDNNSAWGLLGGGYNALWIVCIGALVFMGRTLRRDAVLAFLALALLGIIAFYALIYIGRPFFSVERYLMHAAPLAVLAAARATHIATHVTTHVTTQVVIKAS